MKRFLAFILTIIIFTAPIISYAEHSDVINIDMMQDTRLSDVLYSIAYSSGRSIVINAKLDNYIKGSIKGKDIYSVLDYLAYTNNFNYEVLPDGTILVSPADTMTTNKSFKLIYANLEDAKKQLMSFVDEKKIQIDIEQNTIAIDGTALQIRKAAQKLKEMDFPAKQILLEVQLVEVSKDTGRDLGIAYQMPGYNSTTGPLNADNISWAVTTYANDIIGSGKVLARPSMVTQNGRKATVKMIDKVPILTVNISNSGDRQTQVAYEDVGITFIGTPRVNFENGEEQVTMDIHPTASAITKWVTNGDTKAPQIASREAETVVRVKSGETIIIGGLLKDEEIEALNEVPYLSQLPILGGLFKYYQTAKGNSEVFIFVTPTVLNADGSLPKNTKSKLQTTGIPEKDQNITILDDLKKTEIPAPEIQQPKVSSTYQDQNTKETAKTGQETTTQPTPSKTTATQRINNILNEYPE
ncbi:MAG: hypothetical protein WC725_04640 [Patescibacteria group bacterium]|jgi:type II secretory pathway component GspD/PulD (secretin)